MNIDVQFHALELKSDYKRCRIKKGSTEFVNLLNEIVQLDFSEFEKRGTGAKPHFTFRNLIDLEFLPKEGELELDRLVFHGEYFTPNDPNPARILSQIHKFNLYPQRIDLKFDVSADFVSFETIHEHFRDDNLTATASYTSWTSPEGAKTWYCGVKRPSGYLVSFYEAWKIHTGMPEGSHRIELQLRGAEAQKFVTAFMDDSSNELLEKFMLFYIEKRVTFRGLSNDTNKARWPVCKWWQAITEGAGNFSEHAPVARKALAANRIRRFHQTITGSFDKLGLELFALGLGMLLKEKPQVLAEVFNLYPALDPSFIFE